MNKSRVAKGALAGAIGGLAGTWAMNRFQRHRPAVTRQYVFGGAMGALYGAFCEFSPAARKTGGAAFGTAVWNIAGEADPGQRPARRAQPVASHIVYGVTTEIVRRGVRALLDGAARPRPFDRELPPSRSRSARGSSDPQALRGRRDT
jgi:hypothetical protein